LIPPAFRDSTCVDDGDDGDDGDNDDDGDVQKRHVLFVTHLTFFSVFSPLLLQNSALIS